MNLADWLDGRRPAALVTLGSGLGALAEELEDPRAADFAELGLPAPTVPGHTGRLLVGRLGGVEILAQQGRLHLYEGVPAEAVTAVVRAAGAAGVGTYLVTNAAGGLRPHQSPGHLVLLSDHLNLTGASPLTGRVPPAFVDMAGAYSPALRARARAVAAAAGVFLAEGVYAGLAGPAYETPAEVRMLRALGADLVGMSTVLEVVEARAAGMAVLGVSLVTNVHRAGGTPTDHAEVLEAAAAAGPALAAVVRGVVATLARG